MEKSLTNIMFISVVFEIPEEFLDIHLVIHLNPTKKLVRLLKEKVKVKVQ